MTNKYKQYEESEILERRYCSGCGLLTCRLFHAKGGAVEAVGRCDAAGVLLGCACG